MSFWNGKNTALTTHKLFILKKLIFDKLRKRQSQDNLKKRFLRYRVSHSSLLLRNRKLLGSWSIFAITLIGQYLTSFLLQFSLTTLYRGPLNGLNFIFKVYTILAITLTKSSIFVPFLRAHIKSDTSSSISSHFHLFSHLY